MSDKTATVHWEGRGKQGIGKISTQTEALKSYPYGFASRFEDDKRGTNPEELLAAAHAACFTMAFSFGCDAAGFATAAVDTQAAVRLVLKGGGFSIEHIGLRLEASVPGMDEATKRLAHLEQHGPTQFAFTFKTTFEPDEQFQRGIDWSAFVPCPAT